jgi:hypothetical protein
LFFPKFSLDLLLGEAIRDGHGLRSSGFALLCGDTLDVDRLGGPDDLHHSSLGISHGHRWVLVQVAHVSYFEVVNIGSDVKAKQAYTMVSVDETADRWSMEDFWTCLFPGLRAFLNQYTTTALINSK